MLDSFALNAQSDYSCNNVDYLATAVGEMQTKRSPGQVVRAAPADTKTRVRNVVGRTAALVEAVDSGQYAAYSDPSLVVAALLVCLRIELEVSQLRSIRLHVVCCPGVVHLANGPAVR